MLGIPAPPCAERWCTDSCPLEAKHTGTQYLTWFGKSPTSTGEVNIIRDRQRKELQHTWRRRITSLKLYSHCSHTLLHKAAGLLPLAAILSFSPHVFLSCSLLCSNFATLSWCLFIGKNGATTPTLIQQWWLSKSMVGAVHLLHINGNQPNKLYYFVPHNLFIITYIYMIFIYFFSSSPL